jgi:hypothetical protein
MFSLVLVTVLWSLQCLPPVSEPDGSRTVGVVPPFHGQPAPPVWLRTTSHALVVLACRHYLYEAYGDERGAWLVRYVSFPERGATFQVGEQVLLFHSEGWSQPEPLSPDEVQCHALAATYHEHTFVLVDRRDLLRRPSFH